MGNAGTVLRFVLIAISGVLLFTLFGQDEDNGVSANLTHPPVNEPAERAQYKYCNLKTDHFDAQLSSRGATLRRLRLLSKKYTKNGVAYDMSTTPQPGVDINSPEAENPNAKSGPAGTAQEYRQQLFFQFRNLTSPGVSGNENWNMPYDSVDWDVAQPDPTTCAFSYQDSDVELRKVIKVTPRPYELEVTTTIKNVSSGVRAHAAAIDTVAWWLNEAVEGSMFRVSPYVTNVECVLKDGEAVRLLPAEFEPDNWDEPIFDATGDHRWAQPDGDTEFTAVSNAYFSHALAPLDEQTPVCQLQIEQRGKRGPSAGSFYRARLAYPAKNLSPGESASYRVLTYAGPKERKILALAADGTHNLLELIDLGFFASIAKVLVSFLLKVYGVIPNWGVAIIVLTVCARVLLFPLSIPGIRTMLKMRELKPEMDELNEKYKDDMRAKGAAQMELWRKHNMSPFDQVKGCIPQLATMPVWFALYTTLQTAVELYNIPFLWFPDLSEPDPWFILPFIIGGTFFLQQKIMPFQGDPAQRKMMMYFMPGMFTVFMLFLPSGLGVYMFTNSLLAIVQQQVVEAHAKKTNKSGKLEVEVKEDSEAPAKKLKRKRKRA